MAWRSAVYIRTVWLLCVVQVSTASIGNVVVQTEGGTLRGAFDGSHTSFFGIPYAAAPTGANRWTPPKSATKWEGIRDATKDVQAKCLQNWDAGIINELTDGIIGRQWLQKLVDTFWGPDGDEDCLFLNVQTPQVQPATLLPVMVYIHGGTNLVGSGSGYNASSLCSRDVIFVSFNYRLGVFGYGTFNGALAERGTAGNYGLQDQRFALEWVQRNIKLFGGDSQKVTVSGESAGAMAVIAHMALPRSRDLFARGIVMSGNDDSLPLNEALTAGELFAHRVGCSSHGFKHDSQHAVDDAVLQCLRSKKAEDIVGAQLAVFNQSMRLLQAPVQDGYELPLGVPLRALYSSGKLQPKPVLAGSNINDSSLFFGSTPREILRGVVSRDLSHSIRRFFVNTSKEVREEIKSFYTPPKFGGMQLALYALGTDGYFECPTRRVLRTFAAKEDVYHYIYAAQPSSPADFLGLPTWLNPLIRNTAPLKWLGAFHGSNEIVFWGAEDETSALTPEERSLGRRMIEAWTTFAHGKAPWEPYGAGETHIMLDSVGDSTGTEWHSAECSILEKYRFIWNPLENPEAAEAAKDFGTSTITV